MKKVKISKSTLKGRVKISGAKNSALKLLAASLLTDDEIVIRNFPAGLSDIRIHVEMLEILGKACSVDTGEISIKQVNSPGSELNWEKRSIRNTLLIFGALLSRTGNARVPLPGGCNIGNRGYDIHKMVLESLGAKVYEENGYLIGSLDSPFRGSDITLPIRSTGATENAIISAVLAEGETTIWNPHVRPEIIDLVAFLRNMGANIEIRGQECIAVSGVTKLQGAEHRVIPDNIEAITYLIGAIITNSKIEIEDFPFDHLEVPLIYLRESGGNFSRKDGSLMVQGGNCYPIDTSTGPYPGINSDMQPMLATFGLCARGETRITDLRFPDRVGYIEELKKFGGTFHIDNNYIRIIGGPLRGARVKALDLRCGAALVLAGLVAEGETCIENFEQVERGYEDLVAKMKKLGVSIEYV